MSSITLTIGEPESDVIVTLNNITVNGMIIPIDQVNRLVNLAETVNREFVYIGCMKIYLHDGRRIIEEYNKLLESN